MLFHSLFSSYIALAATLAAASPTPTDSSPLARRTTHCGLGTVYTQQGGTGSCGHKLPDSSLVIALSNVWQLGQSPGPYCGRKIQVTNKGSDSGTGGKGNTVIATVQDMCPGCDRERLDFSVGAWNQLTNGAAFGTINICWHFCNVDGTSLERRYTPR